MQTPMTPPQIARLAGLLYLVIIVCGLFSELAVREPALITGDAAATLANLEATAGLFRLAFVADSLMILADVGLAAALYLLFRAESPGLALTAAALRLVQSAILAANLLHQHAALALLGDGRYRGLVPDGQLAQRVLLELELHGDGYDLALIPFGLHCVVLALMLWRTALFPRLLAPLMAAAGVVYLLGSYAVFVAPAASPAIAPFYAICLLAELGFCLYLLIRGVRRG